MCGENAYQFLVVASCSLVMAQMGGRIGPIEQGRRVLHFVLQHKTVLVDSILPLLQFQIHSSLAQMQVCRPLLRGNLLVQYRQGVVPVRVLLCLSLSLSFCRLGLCLPRLLRQYRNKQDEKHYAFAI